MVITGVPGVWKSDPLTCSITSGAIQHGVPTKVFRTLFLVMSPPVARKELTPKSEKMQNKFNMAQSQY